MPLKAPSQKVITWNGYEYANFGTKSNNEEKSISLRELNSQILNETNESHGEIFWIGRDNNLSGNLSRISRKSYNDDTITHSNAKIFNL